MRIFSSQTRTKFRHRSNASRRFRHIGALFLLAIVVIFFFRNPLGNMVSYASAPIYALRTWFVESTWSLPVYLRSKHALMTERDALRGELTARAADAERLTQLSRDNEMLRALLGVNDTTRIAAGVAMRPNATPYDTILIDRGTGDGVVEGALVYAEGDVAIGTIARAFSESALAVLFSTPGVRVPAYIFGPDTFAQAEGRGGGVIRIGVPQGVSLKEGDAVIVPSASPGVIGRIAYIESDESNPEQYAFIPMTASIASLRYVAVDTRAMPTLSYTEALDVVTKVRETLNAATFASTTVSTTTPTQ